MKTKIEKIPPPPINGRLIAVSDIHGYVNYLKGLLEKLHFSPSDILVVIGDIIEKGPESLSAVRFILDLIDRGFQVFASMGNVEESRLRDFLDNDPEADKRFLNLLHFDREVWGHGLFLDMTDELGISIDGVSEQSVPALKNCLLQNYGREIGWLSKLPTVLTSGNFIFAHAGIPTDNISRLRDTDAMECLKRDAFLQEDIRFTKFVVTGHWPVVLYQTDSDCMTPIYDSSKHIIAIDGGCALKFGAQLNALILPAGTADMDTAYFESYDDYPVIIADHPQEARKATIHIRYFNCSVDILEERDDIALLRQQSTGCVFFAPKSFLYNRPGQPPQCSDYSDALLKIDVGDRLSVIAETSIGRIVKKAGVIGWYLNIREK